MDKIVTSDPTQPGLFKVNGPSISSGGKIALSDLDVTGAVNGDLIELVAGVWTPVTPPVPAAPDTASNLGAGAEVFSSKVASDFQFRSIVQGTGITVTQNANDVTVALTGGGSFTESFESAQQVITQLGTLTIAHGLSGIPTLIQAVLVNLVGELGYSPGQELMVKMNATTSGQSDGVALYPDATNLNVKYGNGTQAYYLFRFDNGNNAAITNANWAIVFRAWL